MVSPVETAGGATGMLVTAVDGLRWRSLGIFRRESSSCVGKTTVPHPYLEEQCPQGQTLVSSERSPGTCQPRPSESVQGQEIEVWPLRRFGVDGHLIVG